MKKTRKFQSLAAKFLIPALTLFSFTQCSDDTTENSAPAAVETEELTASASSDQEEPVLSLTIDGVHTVLSSTIDCKTCDYMVPANATVVDGKKLNIKPGQAICLDAAIKYGNLRLINLEGKEDNPITVAYGVKSLADISEPAKPEVVQ